MMITKRPYCSSNLVNLKIDYFDNPFTDRDSFNPVLTVP